MLEINYNQRATPKHNDIYVLFAPDQSNLLLLEWDDRGAVFPMPDGLETTELSYIGTLDGQSVWSGYLSELSDGFPILPGNSDEIDSFSRGDRFLIKLRKGLKLLREELYMTACRASIVAYWRKRSRFCGICGTQLEPSDMELAMTCPVCNERYYPQVAPVIIVSIRRDDRILMVRSKRNLSSFYGLVAGYVEAGESLEEAVHREVKEETNLEVKNVQYVKSQPWPFPHSQMMAFTADHKAGELCIQREELIEAQWFRADEIPPMPPRLSVGGFLVEKFMREMEADS